MAVKGSDTRIDIREEIYASSQEDFKKLQSDTILKRIPVGAEATTVLVRIISMRTYTFIILYIDSFNSSAFHRSALLIS